MNPINLIIHLGCAISRNEARRIIFQGGLKIEGERIILTESDNLDNLKVFVGKDTHIEIGNKKFIGL